MSFNINYCFIFIVLISLFSCNQSNMKDTLDIQGHRGCRGLYPENTIEGYIKALELGVRTLEMDVVVSKDKKVVLSHEPFFNHEISTHPDSTEITEKNEKEFNLYNLTYDKIKTYDVGMKDHPRFPNQTKTKALKPLLSDMFSKIEQYKAGLSREVYYNIEIKRKPEQDNIFHPEVSEFVDLVMQVIVSSDCSDRVTVQCFDHETLRILHSKYPSQKTVMLVEDILPPTKHLDMIGYTPTIYSPDDKLVNPQLVKFCHQQGMLLVPWTVNTPERTIELIQMGVDGIISDYPDMTIEVWEGLQTKK